MIELYCDESRQDLFYNRNVISDTNKYIFIGGVMNREIINSIDSIGLTEKERKSFKLYYINDLSIKEISNMLDTTENNIKYYLYSSRKKIKEEFTYE